MKQVYGSVACFDHHDDAQTLQVISPSNLFVVVFFGNRFSLNIFLQNSPFETSIQFIVSFHRLTVPVRLLSFKFMVSKWIMSRRVSA